MLDGKGENQAHIISYMALFCRSAGLCFGFVDFFGGVGWMRIILRDSFYIIDLFIILFFSFLFSLLLDAQLDVSWAANFSVNIYQHID